jgi:xanthine dehydrogenase accessory factor
MNAIYQALAQIERNHESAALCTVISSEGSTPRHVGSKMLVYPDGKFIGTVGGGDLEHRVLDEAWIAMTDGESRLLSYRMADPSRGDPGVCGGTVEVFVEPILPPAMVVVIGAGHVGKAVVHLAKWLGFRVAVSDDRPEFCNPEAVPGADAYYPVPMAQLPEQLKINKRTYIVITSRGANVDIQGLPGLLDTNPAYIGVIGSRRRWLTTVKAVRQKGIPQEKLESVHSPMGLELNAETPEEIAVSIMAEILMLKAKGTGKPMRLKQAGAQSESSLAARQ